MTTLHSASDKQDYADIYSPRAWCEALGLDLSSRYQSISQALRDLKDNIGLVYQLIDTREKLYRCFWTGAWVKKADVKWIGSVMPGAPGLYPMAPGGEPARRESAVYFNEMDRNCNACQFFDRQKTCKTSGLMYGACKNPNADLTALPYPITDTHMPITTHPADYMGMSCWEPRQ